MKTHLIFVATIWTLKVSLMEALHCNSTGPEDRRYPREPCGDQPNDGDDDEDIYYAPFNDSGYMALIASASVVLPIIVFVRICWLKKLQKQRNTLVNQARQHILNEQREASLRSGIFMIDIDGIPYEEIYGKPPPTYEDSMTNPDCSSPPPYDRHPPSYISVFPGVSCHDNEIPSSSIQDPETLEHTRQSP